MIVDRFPEASARLGGFALFWQMMGAMNLPSDAR